MAPPFSLSDRQLAELMQVAEPLDPSKRLVLVERVAAALRLNGNGHPTDDDVRRALDRAMHGLRHDAA